MENKILARYILKRFIKALIFSLMAFLFIYIITNFFERVGYFIDRGATTLEILKYYALFSPKIIVRIMPLAVLLGVYFSLGLLAKHNEILAMRGLGIPPIKIYRPIFITGFVISVTVLSFNVSLVPESRNLLEEYKRRKIDKVKGEKRSYGRNINYITEEGWIVKIDRVSGDKLFNVNLFKYGKGRLVKRHFAKRGEWRDSTWTLEKVYVREFSSDGKVSFSVKDKMKSNILKASPEELSKSNIEPSDMSFSDLLSYIRRLDKSGSISIRERTELYNRVSYPFMSFIILFFGCPLALEVKRRGLIFGFGLGILSAFTFWGIIQLFKELGIKGTLTPSLAAITPDILFLTAGVYLLLRGNRT